MNILTNEDLRRVAPAVFAEVPIADPTAFVRINQALWALAERYAEAA